MKKANLKIVFFSTMILSFVFMASGCGGDLNSLAKHIGIKGSGKAEFCAFKLC
jgi:hypothetical protein